MERVLSAGDPDACGMTGLTGRQADGLDVVVDAMQPGPRPDRGPRAQDPLRRQAASRIPRVPGPRLICSG